MTFLKETLAVLYQFGGFPGNHTDVAVRFLLPAFFWIILAFVAFRERHRTRRIKDTYIASAAVIGLGRELIMFVAEYGSSRHWLSFESVHPLYPPLEHAMTSLSGVLIAAAFIDQIPGWHRFSQRYFAAGSIATALLYILSALFWPLYLENNPASVFGSFWGDAAYRYAGVALFGTALAVFFSGRIRGARVRPALLFGFAFLFLDEFLMIFNLHTGERHAEIFNPLRQNFHIWAIPLFLGVYWADLRKSLIQALQDIRQERNRSEAIIAAIGDGISIQNTDFLIIYQNRIHKDLLGDHVGELCYQAYRKRNSVCTGCPTQQMFRDGNIHRTESSIRTAEGERQIEMTTSPLRDPDGRIIAGIEVVRDVTDRTRLQNEIAKSQKLESIGLLAGGLAHDFNNLLTAIFGNVGLAKLYIESGPKAHELLEEAEAASLRAKDLTNQLLTFSRGGAPVKKTLSITEIIKESVLFNLSGSKVKVEFRTGDSILPVEADPGQMNQVFTNLTVNALQAMPEGGTLAIAIENLKLNESVLPIEAGDYIKISVTDTGIGMPGDILPRIFDPYFTTKQKGSGLGLATVYSIVKKHGGLITVESTPGKGSSFHLYLPASRSTVVEGASPKSAIIPGSGKILLMDDEEVVRNIAGEMLKKLGYSYAFALDGKEAVELYEQARNAKSPFDVVIMDLTVPGGMGGKEAVQKLLALDPKAIAIVSSGYSNDAVLAGYQQYGFRGVIEKPYSIANLSIAIHTALQSSAAD